MPIGNALSIVRNYRQFIPYITSVDNISAELNNPGFLYQITADNDPISFKASPIPSGLTLNTTTGLLSGTPTSIAVGGTYVTLSATNSSGTGTKRLLIKIFPPPPVITSTLTATPVQNISFTYNIIATNMFTNYGSIYGATNLPTGLNINTGTGVIQGTVGTISSYESTITASNNGGSDTKTIVFDVMPPKPVVTLRSGNITNNFTAGSNIRITFTATNSPTSYNISSLPSFLTYSDPDNNVIDGTAPSENLTRTYVISVSATNRTGTGIGSILIGIIQPPNITNLPRTVVGSASTTLSFSCVTNNMDTIDGIRRYTYAAISAPAGVAMRTGTQGTWWDGMALNASNVPGQVDLFNTIRGNYVIDIFATNSAGNSTTKRLTFTFI